MKWNKIQQIDSKYNSMKYGNADPFLSSYFELINENGK